MGNKVCSELEYVPFSEERVVSKLIRERSSQDASYYPVTEPSGIQNTDGVFSLNEDVICIYASLDSLVDRAGQSEAELLAVRLQMKGYALSDIAEHYGKARQSFEILFKRAIKKIVKRNNADWEKCIGARIDDD